MSHKISLFHRDVRLGLRSDLMTFILFHVIRDWSLITGRGGATNREGGGHVKFYPYEKGGAEKMF